MQIYATALCSQSNGQKHSHNFQVSMRCLLSVSNSEITLMTRGGGEGKIKENFTQ